MSRPVDAAAERVLRRPVGWWVPPLYVGMALVLVPWIAVLANTLPDRAVSHNYRLAWVGFDVLLGLSMVRTAYLSWRRSPFVVNVASATATLLVVDAWFDVTTAPNRTELMWSVALAVLVELPAAALSLAIAARAQLTIARTGLVGRPGGLLSRWSWVSASEGQEGQEGQEGREGQESTSRVVNRAQASAPNTAT